METLCDRVIRYKWLVTVTLLAAVVISASRAGDFLGNFKSDYRVFFADENSQLLAFEAMQRIYSKSDNVAFIVSPKDGQIFTQETLTALWTITEAAWQLPYSTRVDSITNFQHTTAVGDDLLVEDLVLDPTNLTEQRISAIRNIVLNEPLLKKRLISPQGHVSVVNVTVQLPGIDKTKEVPQVSAAARAMRDAMQALLPDVDIRLSGMVMMNTSFPEASQEDMSTLIPLMFLVVLITVAILIRSVTGMLATLVVIFTSISATMGFAGWIGMYATGPSVTAPIMILTLAVADCIHILSSMIFDMRHGMDKRSALLNSLRINLQPVFLTSLTTAIGFLSMNFSDSPPFADLGNMVAVGVVLAFVFSITLFPALLMILPMRVRARSVDSRDLMAQLGDWVVAQRRWLFPAMVAITLVVSLGISKNELNDDFVKYFDQSVPFREATDYMQENLTGLTTLEISLQSQQPSGINDPAFLQTTENLANWLREQAETEHVNTITDTLKRLNKNMHGDEQSWYRLPSHQDLAAQYLLLYEMSLPYGLDLNNQLDIDKSSTRLVATFKNLTSAEILALNTRILDWFAENGNGYKIDIASPSLMFADIGQRNILSMLTGVGLALFLISALLGLALRSFKYGLISLVPNILPATIGFGLWGLLYGQVGLGLSVVAGMTLGIIVDDTVHFLSKYLRARREKGLNAEDGVRYAFRSVGLALTITTFVLAAGFLVLAQSSFKVNADMGLLTAITIIIALVLDFLLLPPLLMLIDKKSDKELVTEKTSTIADETGLTP